MDNKTLRIELTLANVSVVVEREMNDESWEKFAKLGMASDGYRAVATKAFKGVKDRASLAYETAEPLVSKAFTDAGYKVVSTEKYVAPEKESEMKRATAMFDDFVKRGVLAEKAKIVGCKADDSADVFIAAIHSYLQGLAKNLAK